MGGADQQRTPGTRVSELIQRTAVITLTVIAIVGLVWLLVRIHHVLLWVLIGIVLAIALAPAVSWLVRHRWPRVVAALFVSLLTIAVLAGLLVAVAVPVVTQTTQFVLHLPDVVRSVFGPTGQLHFFELRFHVLERLATVTPGDVGHLLAGNQKTILATISRVASGLAATLTTLTIMVMLLIEGPRGWSAVLGALVGEERRWTERIGDHFLRATGGYVRGNLAISVVAGVASYVVLRILGVPYAETLAVLVAILDIVPLVGATIAAVIVALVGFAAGGAIDAIVLIVFFIIYQQFENNVLQNLVYAKTLRMSPLLVFVAALVGASLAGLVGVLLAIPLASACWTLGRDLIALRQARQAARAQVQVEGSEAPPDQT
jgi:predicted PurR-regulated permease PerM